MNLIFDTHAHYDDKQFDEDRDELLNELFNNKGVCAIVNQGTDVETSRFSVELAHKYENVYAAVGLHPEYLDNNSVGELEKLLPLYDDEKVVAVGEIGLDYYYDVPRELQREVFEKQLKLSLRLSLPVNIHDREAHGDTLNILKKYKPRGILHCFSGSAEMAAEIVKLGMYIGIGGVITFKNAKKAVSVIESVPLERIVLETDCPYLSPVPYRGKRNDSSYIIYTAQKIAEIKNTDAESVLEITRQNAVEVYGINRRRNNI